MAKKKQFKVSKDRLYAELKKRGVSPTQAAESFGFSRHYIHNAVSAGWLNETCAVLLERVYGIKREAYEAVDAPVETAQSEIKSDGIDHDKLYLTIYAATYHAYRQAFIDRRDGKY